MNTMTAKWRALWTHTKVLLIATTCAVAIVAVGAAVGSTGGWILAYVGVLMLCIAVPNAIVSLRAQRSLDREEAAWRADLARREREYRRESVALFDAECEAIFGRDEYRSMIEGDDDDA